MNELEQSRKEINEIDSQMARLFERRMNICANIARYKKEHGLSVRDPAREEDLINKTKNLSKMRNSNRITSASFATISTCHANISRKQ